MGTTERDSAALKGLGTYGFIKDANGGWHFYLERTRGYGKGTLLFALMRLADLQRVDLGIAMCHFELAARAGGLAGTWVLADPGIAADGREYTATWLPKDELQAS